VLHRTGAKPGATWFHRVEEPLAFPATVPRTILEMP